jgi:hypothetical protein
METLILHTQNPQDALLIIQLAVRLGIPYSKTVEVEKRKKEISETVLSLAKPLSKTLDVEAIKKERNYKGVNRKRFDKLVKEIALPQSAEELIAQL